MSTIARVGGGALHNRKATTLRAAAADRVPSSALAARALSIAALRVNAVSPLMSIVSIRSLWLCFPQTIGRVTSFTVACCRRLKLSALLIKVLFAPNGHVEFLCYAGRILVAKRNYKAGEVLFTDSPLNLIHFGAFMCYFPALEAVCKQVTQYLQQQRGTFNFELEPFVFLPALQVC